MNYAVITFGCRVNQADSLALEEQLLSAGAVASAPADADLVVVNTCSVTATADQGARQAIRRIARHNPSARIVVTGCYATREPSAVAALPNVLHLVPNGAKDSLVEDLWPEMTTSVRYAGGVGECGSAVEAACGDAVVVPGVAGRTAFTLPVQTGCEEQ